MKNKEKMEWLSGYAMEVADFAAGTSEILVVPKGGPAPKQPKKREQEAFLDGLSIAFAVVAALIDMGIPVKPGHEPAALVSVMARHWVEAREERRDG